MSIPTYDKLFRPVLEMAAREPITRTSANKEMLRQFKLTPAEVDQKLASGGSTMRNRTGWAMTFLTKGKLIEKIATKTYRATAYGREFLGKHPQTITLADLRSISDWEASWGDGKKKAQDENPSLGFTDQKIGELTATPEEIIEREVNAMNTVTRDRLLQAVLDQSPEFFERLVLEVLQAMGYGGKLAVATEHVGRSGDEGIDGRINQDALGLDQILVQAKRYAIDNTIGRPTIQAFVGSLAGQGVNKGVFITTSSFADGARDYVQRGSNLKVVLIDGEMLIDLMIKHGIGTRVAHKYEIHELDQNYFEDE
ncbi:MAG: restriction endonuclease [Opitutaceae bacterium]|jgi:restriction system protein